MAAAKTCDVSFLLECEIGPPRKRGADIFSVLVVMPEALSRRPLLEGPVIADRAFVVFARFSFRALEAWLRETMRRCAAPTWPQSTVKLQRYFRWEYKLERGPSAGGQGMSSGLLAPHIFRRALELGDRVLAATLGTQPDLLASEAEMADAGTAIARYVEHLALARGDLIDEEMHQLCALLDRLCALVCLRDDIDAQLVDRATVAAEQRIDRQRGAFAAAAEARRHPRKRLGFHYVRARSGGRRS